MKAKSPVEKNHKRINKRKLRNKRRRQQRQMAENTPTADAQQLTNPTSNKRRRSCNQVPYESASKKWRCDAAEMWRNTYFNVLRWHSEHQMNFWRQRAVQLQQENLELQRLNMELMGMHQEDLDENEAVDDECDEDEEDVEEEESFEPVDEGYLDFLEITLKHRAELKAQRAKEAAEESVEQNLEELPNQSC